MTMPPRDPIGRSRTPLADAQEKLSRRVETLNSELADVRRARGRVLAERIVSTVDIPSFERSAMDGYAVRAGDIARASSSNESRLVIIGQSLPARPYPRELRAGEAVRITTGAPIPAGSDAVAMIEYTREDQDAVLVSTPIPAGKNIIRIGEDIRSGQILLEATRTLRPQDLAVAAAVGVASLSVVRRPTVSLIITGNELLPPGRKPSGFQIVDTNSVLLRALVERDGGRFDAPATDDPPIFSDDRELIRRAILESTADCLIISGGSSVGSEDHAPGLVAELGELTVHGLALRPAAPAGFGFVNGRPVFLIPGNPVACLCAYDLLAGRAIRQMGGRSPELPYRQRSLPLSREIPSALGRTDYVRVRINANGAVDPHATGGGSVLSSTTQSDGFMLVPHDIAKIPAGEAVVVYEYD